MNISWGVVRADPGCGTERRDRTSGRNVGTERRDFPELFPFLGSLAEVVLTTRRKTDGCCRWEKCRVDGRVWNVCPAWKLPRNGGTEAKSAPGCTGEPVNGLLSSLVQLEPRWRDFSLWPRLAESGGWFSRTWRPSSFLLSGGISTRGCSKQL